ncbi:hypothetical protein KIH74_14980 [Kineosporia sp. J2-2]|uniref:Uncharacterized protein n=1 Tax=Kineosporia corallincola TaxID=2835133 RepID=A0ABS5THA1_9ACTN|nr:hypothetical protein [Kineosporia corallincola]MBT0770243.1 hypothetical protein [Kineosporia corallincola]
MLMTMGTPRAPLTADDYRGVPAEDAERLRDWNAHVPDVITWLRERSGLILDSSAESLRGLWIWAMDHIAHGGAGLAVPHEVPPWTRWRPYRYASERELPYQLWLWGALSAYFGEVFIAFCTLPEVEWRIFRHSVQSVMNQGEFVLLRPAHIKRNKPRNWICPHQTVGVLLEAQSMDVNSQDGFPVGRDDPGRLQALLFMRLREFGEGVAELTAPAAESDKDPGGTLRGMLDAPQVGVARLVCPPRWVAIPDGLDDDDFTFTTEEVCEGIGFAGQGGHWSMLRLHPTRC